MGWDGGVEEERGRWWGGTEGVGKDRVGSGL